MSDAKKIKLSVNINNLPPEMVERILKFLPFKEICQARLICKRWKEIIDKGNLVKDAAGNDLSRLPWKAFCSHFSLNDKRFFLKATAKKALELKHCMYCLWFQLLSFSENISCIIVAGGYGNGRSTETVEVIFGDLRTKQLPNLPRKIVSRSMVLHDGAILLSGGFSNEQKCLQLDHGTWKEHSTLNQKRDYHSAVTTQTATFLFLQLYNFFDEDFKFVLFLAFVLKLSKGIYCLVFSTNFDHLAMDYHTFQVLVFLSYEKITSFLKILNSNLPRCVHILANPKLTVLYHYMLQFWCM